MTLIRTPRLQQLAGSQAYYLTSLHNAWTKAAGDPNLQLRPSKLAALELPPWASGQFFLSAQRFDNDALLTNPNQLVPQLLQNYVEAGMSQARSEAQQISGLQIAEPLFWKMLQQAGVNAWQETGGETVETEPGTIVKWVGDALPLHESTYDGETFVEALIQIPTTARKLTGLVWTAQSPIAPLLALPSSGQGADVVLGQENYDDQNKAIYDEVGGLDQEAWLFQSRFDQMQIDWSSAQFGEDGFSFNAVLVWWDLVDSDNQIIERGLGNVIFVDQYQQDGAIWQIPSLEKTIDWGIGNSLAWSLTMRHYWGVDNISGVAVDTSNTISFALYQNAMGELAQINQTLASLQQQYSQTLSQMQSLQSLAAQLQSADVYNRLASLEQNAGNSLGNDALLHLFQETLGALGGPGQIVQNWFLQTPEPGIWHLDDIQSRGGLLQVYQSKFSLLSRLMGQSLLGNWQFQIIDSNGSDVARFTADQAAWSTASGQTILTGQWSLPILQQAASQAKQPRLFYWDGELKSALLSEVDRLTSDKLWIALTWPRSAGQPNPPVFTPGGLNIDRTTITWQNGQLVATGGGLAQGTYPNDQAAYDAGVPPGGVYILADPNTVGESPGTLRVVIDFIDGSLTPDVWGSGTTVWGSGTTVWGTA